VKRLNCLNNFKLLYTVIPLIILVAGYSVVSAQASRTVSVSATVPERPPLEEPDTVIIFQGVSYPSSTLTINQDSSLLVEIATNTQAQFNVQAIIEPGNHTFMIFGEDQDGIIGKESNFTLTLSEGTTTTISGIFLGPTISIDRTVIAASETATLTGTTIPNSELNVTLNSSIVAAATGLPKVAVHIASADGNGRWLHLFNADDLEVDEYTTFAQATDPISESVSETSKSLAFEVVGDEEPDVCDGMAIADINCDGAVDLIDFSILLFYWESTDPANPRADINTDGIVDIIDFSIMMFYWSG